MKNKILPVLLAALLMSAAFSPSVCAASDEPAPAASGEIASDEPSGEAALPAVFASEDGSVLEIWPDGTCAYETEVSGRVNDMPMSGRLTFHGDYQDGVFHFDRVTWHGLDLTGIAHASGFTDASHWEKEAAALYAGAASDSASGEASSDAG